MHFKNHDLVDRVDLPGIRIEPIPVRDPRGQAVDSPMARETASNTPPAMPGNAAGIMTFLMVSDCVAPSA